VTLLADAAIARAIRAPRIQGGRMSLDLFLADARRDRLRAIRAFLAFKAAA
jgi:hypothetical protein